MPRKKNYTALFAAAFIVLSAALPAPAAGAGGGGPGAAMGDAAKAVLSAVKSPQIGSVGGDWAVFGLLRSGCALPAGFIDGYCANVEKYAKERKGVLDERKYTEYSRVAIALTAAGRDPRSVGGYDLLAPLGDFEKTAWQGINGPVFALIALDSAGYAVPANPAAKVQATREMYVQDILGRQQQGGGFALTASKTTPDADITAMALQALARYKGRPDVAQAVERALKCLSEMRGGWEAWGDEGLESVAQAVVALCELGLGVGDPRFSKGGATLADKLMKYYIPGKGFEKKTGGGFDQMSTEQALCALAAVARYDGGGKRLYDLTDAAPVGKPPGAAAEKTPVGEAAKAGLPGKHADVKAPAVTSPGKSFADAAGSAERGAIEGLAARGVINGKTETKFEPGATITRAEFAAVVTRGLGLSMAGPPGQAPGKPAGLAAGGAVGYAELRAGDWFYGSVAAASKYGIVNGESAERFNPNGAVTREEAAVMVARAAKLCGLDASPGAGDAQAALAAYGDGAAVSGWAREQVAFCCLEGIIPGGAQKLMPKQAASRGEVAGMLYRLLKKAELL